MTTETALKRPRFPATAAVGRCIIRPLRWLWRRKLKVTLWLATLITLGWQYENWHGRRAYQEQLALFHAEYGDLKWHDFAPPRIPDDENFFAAPVFETFVVKEPRALNNDPDPDRRAYFRRMDEITAGIPHARFLNMKLPEISTVPCGFVPERPAQEGIAFLDPQAWAAEEAKAGRTLPDGMTALQWLRASLPEDATVQGFIAALDRRKAGRLPHVADRWKVGEELNSPVAIPIASTSGVFESCRRTALRARVAARTGDGQGARQLCEVLCLLAEGFGHDPTLVGALVALAIESEMLAGMTEGLACRVWTDADLAILQERLLALDEERMLYAGLSLESFGLHLWRGDLRQWFQVTRPLHNGGTGNWLGKAYLWICRNGPEGWGDANLAHHLRWWRTMMVPNKPGDDLLALRDKLSVGQARVMDEVKRLATPRDIWAKIAIPSMSNIASTALENQTRRRQLLLAIAIERHLLSKSSLPQKAEDLVPAFLDAIPGDPHAPGTPLRWEVPAMDREPERSATSRSPVIRYRILSAQKDAALGFPEQVP